MSELPLRSPGADTLFSHKGFRVPDPFAPRERPAASFFHAVLATALFRCWHILLLLAAWSTLITVLNDKGYHLRMQPTLLTVIGTVLGFVVSYRTTSSFERYNEGRRLWSQIILASRTFARTVWFHVPDPDPRQSHDAERTKMRSILEKKTVINLLEAYAVSVKHYLRGEDGIYFKDLYYIVKYLPGYALPAGRPSFNSDYSTTGIEVRPPTPKNGSPGDSLLHERTTTAYSTTNSTTKTLLPLHVTSPSSSYPSGSTTAQPDSRQRHSSGGRDYVVLTREAEHNLQPGYLPPKYHFFDFFPFSLVVNWLAARRKDKKGKKVARMRAKLRSTASHNIPLEISLYLSSYISALQRRKLLDVPTTNTLFQSLNDLVGSLTGLERVLTTPIPFSYSVHLWVVTALYCWAMPFQLWSTFGWLTIPGTTAASFIYFGFLVAGEEIENPFGYDMNDLNLDHFTHNIIRNELRAVTSAPPPDPADWVFSPENDLMFSSDYEKDERVTPEEWMKQDYASLLAALQADEPTNLSH
ncbi:hypothetical protein APHAL10511_005214 [Amanita phalloides]|nr:hypothetical protein APHAL10511_005214 [Amanita phalloides]